MDETAADSAASPVIGLPACRQIISKQVYHVVGEKYLVAAATAAGGVPLTLPALGEEKDLSAILDRLDGLLVTGSPSNVEPHHYDGPASADGTHHDPSRDDTMLPLIPAAIAARVPVLAICRGIQELNVALGGTLHQRIEDMPGKLNHQADPADPVETRYGPVHAIALSPGGVLATIAATLGLDIGAVQVNSLHSQGIDRLAPGLAVEATAPDGIVEAVRVTDAPAFALGIQWHPEWRIGENPFSMAIFAAFGDAARRRAQDRIRAASQGTAATARTG